MLANSATHRQKTFTDKGTLLCVLKYFKSNETCLLSHFSEKIIPKFVCCMVKISMPAILHRILHLVSQTMYFRVSYYFAKLHKHKQCLL